MQIKLKYNKSAETLTVEEKDGDEVLIYIGDTLENTSDHVLFEAHLAADILLEELPEEFD